MRLRSLLAGVLFLFGGSTAVGAEINVLSAGGIRPALDQLLSQFERATGHKVTIRVVGGQAVQKEAEAGATFDLVIAPQNMIEALTKSKKLVPATRTDVARAGVGLGVRAGAPKPDIASGESLKRALLGAKSVAFAKDGTAGAHFQGVLERLGISREMEPRLKRTTAADPVNSAPMLVARGEVEMAVAAVATLFAPGIEFVGPLPAEFQAYIQFVAAVGTGAKEPQPAAALIKFITAPSAAAAYRAKGMEPAGPRH